MRNIRLIAADMDHTLLTESGELPPNFATYIRALDKLGIHFVIASGRPMYSLTEFFSDLAEQLIFISDNGGAVSYKNNLIFTSLLKPEDYKKMRNFTKEKTPGIPVLCGLKSAFIEQSDKKHLAFLKRFYAKITVVSDIRALNVDANKFTAYFPSQVSEKYFVEEFNPAFGADFSVAVGDTVWVDLMNKGVDKGQAMCILSKKLAIESDQMMAFGDTYNDIEMLRFVKYSYIVANANDDMRQYASYVTKSNNEYGVTHVIKKLLEEKDNEQ
ncbi:HAD family hydrolase [Tetragenococcus solitarius]|uniref:Cof-type HAD-IIB family hydrolase n=1 Tax=Tetragenococcus solitarius TaxID=71453 RepID=A0ABN3YDM4_9ENTE|nr:HAD family hydrolase [Tetragenococcus solitarius]